MAKLLGSIIGVIINIVMIPIALIVAIPMGVFKARKNQKNRLLFTSKEQSLLGKAQRVISMNDNGLISPDRDLFEVAKCIDNSRSDYQIIKSRERFDVAFSDFLLPRIHDCHVVDWNNVISFFEFLPLDIYKPNDKSTGKDEPEWMNKIWSWADEHDIEHYNIPRESNDLINLEHLSFESISYFEREKITLLPKEIGSLVNLKFLELGSAVHPEILLNDLTELPKEIGNLTNITHLYLQFNSLSELPTQVGKLKNLKELKLGGNNLSNLPSEIGALHNLEILTVWNNNLKSIPREIKYLTNLKGLSLWGNPIVTLPEEITYIIGLKKLELGSMPNLVLSPKQKDWVKKLAENGCDIWVDDSNRSLITEEAINKDDIEPQPVVVPKPLYVPTPEEYKASCERYNRRMAERRAAEAAAEEEDEVEPEQDWYVNCDLEPENADSIRELLYLIDEE